MQTLTRYILGQLARVFLLCLVGLTLLMIVAGLYRQAKEQGLQPAQIVQIVPYVLPDMLRYTMPAALLFSSCYVLGSMSGTNEIVALKSLGISPMAVLGPVYVFAFLVSLCTVWLNDVAVTWGHAGARRVVIDSLEEIIYGVLKTERSYASRQFSINVKDVQDRKLIFPTFTFFSRPDAPAMTIMADDAEFRSDPAENKLTIYFGPCSIERGGLSLRSTGEVFETSLDAASKGDPTEVLASRLSLRDIPKQITSLDKEIEHLELEQAAAAGYQLATGDWPALASAEWNTRAAVLQDRRAQLFRLTCEPHRRWSSGFTCLCFVMVGAPLAVRMRNADFLTSFFLCFMPILIIYYPMLAFSVDAAKSGKSPPLIVWLGNIMLVVWGEWLRRRVMRY